MKILCLDQSTKVSGYSVWENKKLVLYGHVDSNIKENLPLMRMRKMSKEIQRLIKQVRPDYIVLEGVQFQGNHCVYSQLSQMQGVLFEICFSYDIGFAIVEPTKWKSFSNIKGRKREEQKANTINYIKEMFNIDPTEDEADSIGIGVWAINNLKIQQ